MYQRLSQNAPLLHVCVTLSLKAPNKSFKKRHTVYYTIHYYIGGRVPWNNTFLYTTFGFREVISLTMSGGTI